MRRNPDLMTGLYRENLIKRLLQVAAMSPCNKRKVGAIIALRRPVQIPHGPEEVYDVLAEGCNYNPAGNSCEDHLGKTLDCVVHAEVSAINKFKEYFLTGPQPPKEFLTLFVTHEPCASCLAHIMHFNIRHEVIKKEITMSTDKLTETLKERGGTYGSFQGNATCTQEIMRALEMTAANSGKIIADYEREALHMIAHKMSRIVNGTKTKKDNWHDIAGYAKLAEDLTQDT